MHGLMGMFRQGGKHDQPKCPTSLDMDSSFPASAPSSPNSDPSTAYQKHHAKWQRSAGVTHMYFARRMHEPVSNSPAQIRAPASQSTQTTIDRG